MRKYRLLGQPQADLYHFLQRSGEPFPTPFQNQTDLTGYIAIKQILVQRRCLSIELIADVMVFPENIDHCPLDKNKAQIVAKNGLEKSLVPQPEQKPLPVKFLETGLWRKGNKIQTGFLNQPVHKRLQAGLFVVKIVVKSLSGEVKILGQILHGDSVVGGLLHLEKQIVFKILLSLQT